MNLPGGEGPSSCSLRRAAVMSPSAPPDKNAAPPVTLDNPSSDLPFEASVATPGPLALLFPRAASPAAPRARSAADKAWQLRTKRRARPPGVTKVCAAGNGRTNVLVTRRWRQIDDSQYNRGSVGGVFLYPPFLPMMSTS